MLIKQAPPIPSHALAAVVLGGWQLATPKGTRRHRALGWIWVGLMAYVAGWSFLISELRLWGAFSPIHLLSTWTLFSLVIAVHHARRGNIGQHKIWMVLLYVLALLLTGLFTLWPGRVMNQVLLGA